MTKSFHMIGSNDQDYSEKKLKNYYQNKLIPAEKKPYLTKLDHSEGPFLAIESSENEISYILDGASQIATLGLGFNHPSLFGCAHYQESWTNDQTTPAIKDIQKRFLHFVRRKLNNKDLHLTFTHSGAESNETALIDAWKKRTRKTAHKVLAFEGSFHGRMLITLSSTWNPSKREPFEWEEFKTKYCSFPEINGDDYEQHASKDWIHFWGNEITKKDFSIPTSWEQDEVLKKEIDSLLEVKRTLDDGEVFAILVEPMQCEGGDRYASSRYFNALALLAKVYQVSIIFDEVQTGFHLGRDFFWHHTFNLKDINDQPLIPDYVTCAKKAQTGMVISKTKLHRGQEYSVASMIRGYHHAMALDQSHDDILTMENYTRKKLDELIKEFPSHFSRPRVKGLSFALALDKAEDVMTFVSKRFDHGLLFYPAGSHTLRFRLNLGFTEDLIDELFNRIKNLAKEIYHNEPQENTPIKTRDWGISNLYQWQEFLLELKLGTVEGLIPSEEFILNKLKEIFILPEGVELAHINKNNFEQHKDEIQSLQEKIYEPERQTSLEIFKKAVSTTGGIGLALYKNNKIVGLAICSQMKNFPLEKVLRRDKNFNDEKTSYVLDITIDKSISGNAIGRYLKYAITALSYTNSTKRINGRNRYRMAKGMIKINLSLGAREIFYIPEDYRDENPYRDCIYYTVENEWNGNTIQLGNGLTTPITISDIDADFVKDNLDVMVNKVCLSNFVSEKFLASLKKLISLAPSELQHAYSCSGQSECVDKVIKSIWYNNRDKRPYKRLITFKGHFFGEGSFLSYSLTHPKKPYFDTTYLECPDNNNFKSVLSSLEKEISENPPLGVFLEPLTQNLMTPTPLEFLKEARKICNKYDVPLIFNETASSMYRYSNDYFFVSQMSECQPDLTMLYMGAQGGLVLCKEKYFIDKPLMMISTWDGDEYSFRCFERAIDLIETNKDEYFDTKKRFEEKLKKLLDTYEGVSYQFHNGNAQLKGNIPLSLANIMRKEKECHIVSPNYSSMKRFINE